MNSFLSYEITMNAWSQRQEKVMLVKVLRLNSLLLFESSEKGLSQAGKLQKRSATW